MRYYGCNRTRFRGRSLSLVADGRSNTMRSCTHHSFLILLSPTGVLAHSDERSCCINNLRHLDGAKAVLELERKLKPGDPVETEMLHPYISVIPQCPAGGGYTIGPIGAYPVCSISGHSQAELKRDVERQARHERILFWLVIGGGSTATAWVVLSFLAARRRL
jgi:hypothetical protein